LAGDASGNETGTYKVSATQLGAIADDYAASLSTTGSVAVGGSTTGNIETSGDVDWFAITGTAGRRRPYKCAGNRRALANQRTRAREAPQDVSRLAAPL
jgi:hypothetical protein